MSERDFESVYALFRDTAGRYPGHAMLAVPSMPGRGYHEAGIEFTYAQVAAEVERLKARYAAAGYGPGHRVALLLGQRPEFFFHYLALNGLGAGIVPVNPDYRHDEMLYQMTHSDAVLAVALDARVRDMRAVGAAREAALPVVPFEDLPASLPEASPAPPAARGLEAECSLLYTSGTTGRPKGCVLSNGYYLNAARWYAGVGGLLTIREGVERICNPLPLFHMNCQAVCATAMMLTGGCLILPDRFHPRRWWADLAETRATAMHYLGVMPPLLLNQPPSLEERHHRLRFGLGAGVEPELHRAFEQRFGVPLVEVWGMTETGRLFADSFEPRQTETRAFGRPFGGFEARVVDDDDREVPRGRDGELTVRLAGPEPRQWFFSGYLKDPAATEKAWAGGWFHTGDIVRQAEDGMLYFVDRKKNIIRRSGENIAAAEVEACLQAHSEVAQVAVVAAPDELREEEVFACIVAMPGAAADERLARALFAWCDERLAYYKPPGWIYFVPELPTTGTQKVQKTRIFPADEDPRRRPGVIDLRELKRRQREANST
jgi:crotonobetaine/carnitine-CoA ligase